MKLFKHIKEKNYSQMRENIRTYYQSRNKIETYMKGKNAGQLENHRNVLPLGV